MELFHLLSKMYNRFTVKTMECLNDYQLLLQLLPLKSDYNRQGSVIIGVVSYLYYSILFSMIFQCNLGYNK